ncbi:MAG: Rab family GTPase [Candidatus Hodarchaeota archaeon]
MVFTRSSKAGRRTGVLVVARKFNLKLILVGDGGVGKTSLVQQFVHARFKQDYKITIGVDVSAKTVDLSNDIKVQLTIHDIGGQDKFAPLRSNFYRGANIAMCVYDITREKTLVSLENKWLPELLEYATTSDEKKQSVHLAIIGNKSDLVKLKSISEEEGQALADKFNSVLHIRTSAKDNLNVDESFTTLARSSLRDFEDLDI